MSSIDTLCAKVRVLRTRYPAWMEACTFTANLAEDEELPRWITDLVREGDTLEVYRYNADYLPSDEQGCWGWVTDVSGRTLLLMRDGSIQKAPIDPPHHGAGVRRVYP